MALYAVSSFGHSAACGDARLHLFNWDIVSSSNSNASLCCKLQIYGKGETNIGSISHFQAVLVKNGVSTGDRGNDYYGDTIYHIAWYTRGGYSQEIVQKYVIVEGDNSYINTAEYETVSVPVSSVTCIDKGGVEVMFHGDIPREDAKWTLLILMSAGAKDLGWICCYCSKYAPMNV